MEANYLLTATSGLMTHTGSENGPLVQTDMQLLSDFCRGTSEFPCSSLIRSCADETAIQFLQSILIPNPKSRLSAKEAPDSTWLLYGEDIDMVDSNQGGSLQVRPAALEPITALNPQGPLLPMSAQTRPSLAEEETITCPFRTSTHPATVKSCGTEFPNLSKLKYVLISIFKVVKKYLDTPVMIFGSREHLRREHFPHLQCPQDVTFVLEACTK